MITAKEAAERTGHTKPAILKAIKNGRLSAKKDLKGQWQIDPAELFRVYPPIQKPEENRVSEVDALQRENSLLRDQLDDLRNDRDQWRQQATALLTDQRGQNSGFWSRLFGK